MSDEDYPPDVRPPARIHPPKPQAFAWGWSQTIKASLVKTAPVRLVEHDIWEPSIIAIQHNAIIDLQLDVTSLRQSGRIDRFQLLAPPWGIAFPVGAGRCFVNVGSSALATDALVFASVAAGRPFLEHMRYPDFILDPAPNTLVCPAYARRLHIAVLTGGGMTLPAVVAAGDEITLTANQTRALTGVAGTVVSIDWEIVAP